MSDTGRRPTRWKVMARDTFAREDYVVGTYATRELAEAAVREREARHAKHQDEAVRDELWIVPEADANP